MMTFNPLGKFVATAPINPAIVAAAEDLFDRLPTCPANTVQRLYGHWTVGHYGQDFPDYNISVRYDGAHFSLDIVGDPRDNAIGVNQNAVHSHTFHRNTGALGISTDDMVFANEHDFGPEPLTMMTLEYLCAGIAAAAAKYRIDLHGVSMQGPFAGEPTFLTHAEAANRPGYPPQYANYFITGERWDLASFVALPAGVVLTADMATACGNALRARAALIKAAIAKAA